MAGQSLPEFARHHRRQVGTCAIAHHRDPLRLRERPFKRVPGVFNRGRKGVLWREAVIHRYQPALRRCRQTAAQRIVRFQVTADKAPAMEEDHQRAWSACVFAAPSELKGATVNRFAPTDLGGIHHALPDLFERQAATRRQQLLRFQVSGDFSVEWHYSKSFACP